MTQKGEGLRFHRRALRLCSSPSRLHDLNPYSTNWCFIDAVTLEHADASLADNSDIKVGLWIDDGASNPQWWQSFADLRVRHQRVQWIAVLQVGRVHDGQIAPHIGQHFVDYFTTPVAMEKLYFAIGHAHGMAELIERSGTQIESTGADHQLVGTSDASQALLRTIRKVAASNAPVFIAGETGTGKELAARAIHEQSPRKHGPFVAVDCGAIPPTLIQSELFGYEKGAFTGATQRKIGRIESAKGGTLFLDEIGNLPPELQVNLLRFLQQSVIHRIGGTQAIEVDTRVIAATHVDLEDSIRHCRFREDLFYRLNVLRLQVPPLRQRECDVEVLASFFLRKFAREHRKIIHGYTTDATRHVLQYTWPGNVRELINRVRRAVVMADAEWITAQDLDLPAELAAAAELIKLDQVREAAERAAIERAIKLSNSNYTAAARLLAVSRPTFYRLLEKHEMLTDRSLATDVG